MQQQQLVLEEEETTSLSFRSFAEESDLNSNSSLYIPKQSVDLGAEIDFEFVHVERYLNLYPVFGVNKISQEGGEDVHLSDHSDDLYYCLWSPRKNVSPPPKVIEKCKSTGSCSFKKWRLMNIMTIGRSKSDGKDKFLFLSTKTSTGKSSNATPVEKKGCKEVERRRSHTTFLPYRNDIISLCPASRNTRRGKF